MASSDRAYILLAFRIIGDLGATIAVPAVLAALLGQWLDAKWGSRPWALIVTLALAFTLTILVLRRKAKTYGDEYQKLINTQKPS